MSDTPLLVPPGAEADRVRRVEADLQHLLHVVSHDVQEPLRMVVSYLELLDERYGAALDERGATYLRFAVDGGRRMQAMTRALLDYARIVSAGRAFVAIDADAVLDEVLRELAARLERCGAIVTRDPLTTVVADPVQLAEVWRQLLANAIEFARPEAPPHLHVSCTRHASTVVFELRDNGLGILPADTERIFDVFTRLPRSGQPDGRGMGLATVRRIVERHGGRCSVESEPGVGSVFRFTMPMPMPMPMPGRMPTPERSS
ncbi:MAG: ATP-binding protein [Ilumatobacteraceae bacterium]